MQTTTPERALFVEICLVLAELYKLTPDESPSPELIQRLQQILKDKEVWDGFREDHDGLWQDFAYKNPRMKPENFSYGPDDIEGTRSGFGFTLSGMLFDLPLVSAALGLDHASQFQKAKVHNAKVRKSFLASRRREAAASARKKEAATMTVAYSSHLGFRSHFRPISRSL